ncbi:hypothetical protein JXQ70_10810 [bacterium]|nr:hypothetical protein [bacterium]
MNLLLHISRSYLPNCIKKRKLCELFELTARAFQSDLPSIRGLSYDDCLVEYARFSKRQAEEVIRQGHDQETIKMRLSHNAYQLGQKLRSIFRIRTRKDVLILCEILYQTLKIEFSGQESGEVTIKRCFFSQWYTPEVCDIISALDQGVIAGISAGGSLVFHERITDGKPCCRATLTLKDMDL